MNDNPPRTCMECGARTTDYVAIPPTILCKECDERCEEDCGKFLADRGR